jgi:hypothetical protein
MLLLRNIGGNSRNGYNFLFTSPSRRLWIPSILSSTVTQRKREPNSSLEIRSRSRVCNPSPPRNVHMVYSAQIDCVLSSLWSTPKLDAPQPTSVAQCCAVKGADCWYPWSPRIRYCDTVWSDHDNWKELRLLFSLSQRYNYGVIHGM